MQLIISSIDTPKMVNSPAFWEGHAGLVHSSMSEGVQLGSSKELMSTVPIRLHLIMGGSILGPEIPPPGILSHDLFVSAHTEWDLRMCFIFHSMGTVNMHNFLEPFLFRKGEVFSESSSFGYGADWCPGPIKRNLRHALFVKPGHLLLLLLFAIWLFYKVTH